MFDYEPNSIWTMIWTGWLGNSPFLLIELIGILIALIFLVRGRHVGPALCVLFAFGLKLLASVLAPVAHALVLDRVFEGEAFPEEVQGIQAGIGIGSMLVHMLGLVLLTIAAFGWRRKTPVAAASAIGLPVPSGVAGAGAAAFIAEPADALAPPPPVRPTTHSIPHDYPTTPIAKRFFMVSIFGSFILFFLLLIPAIIMMVVAYNERPSYGSAPLLDAPMPVRASWADTPMEAELSELGEPAQVTPDGVLLGEVELPADASYQELIAEIEKSEDARRAYEAREEAVHAAVEALREAEEEEAARKAADEEAEDTVDESTDDSSSQFSIDGVSYTRPAPVAVGSAADVLIPASIGLICFGYLLVLYAAVLVPILIYKLWNSMRDGPIRTTPGKAVGFLFIPFFNFYWLFVAYRGWAVDFNNYTDHHGIAARKMSVGLATALCVFALISAIPYLGMLFVPVNIILMWVFFSRAITGANVLRADRAARIAGPTAMAPPPSALES